MPAATSELLGLRITPMTTRELIQAIDEQVRSKRIAIIAHHNLHSLYLAGRNALMRRFFDRADFVIIDGTAVVWLLRLCGQRLSSEKRAACLDWMPVFLPTASADSWRVFYLGSEPSVLTAGLQVIRAQYPDLKIEGHHGHFDKRSGASDNSLIIQRIREFSPQVLLVGMGMPIQECWLLENLEKLPPCVILNMGGYLDYIAGLKPTPPRWLGPLGLEWLYRLCSEPRRLSHRYLVEPLFVIKDLLAELLRQLRQKIRSVPFFNR